MQAAGHPLFWQVLLMLGGAAVAVPLFKRLGLGTVLGYLAVGVALGPVARLIYGGEQLLPVAELGVVLLLFIIGLELKPARLWAMRRDIFGLGAAQVVATGLVLSAFAWLVVGLGWRAAVVVGFGLALSSTAFAMQTLEDQGALNSRHGQTAFFILLFQDVAVAPMLAVLPLLSPGGEGVHVISAGRLAFIVACIAVLLIAGRLLLNPLFRLIASTGAREAMIAAALFVVLGAATLMQMAGLSMALGAFTAGVMLADSSFRHELEADIEPFRGVLLGLFFIAVGLSLDVGVMATHWPVLVWAVPALMMVKAAFIYGLCRLFGGTRHDAARVALVLPQGGEFAFVLFTAAVSLAIMPEQTQTLLVATVTISMALTPLSMRLSGWLAPPAPDEEMAEDFDGAGSDVLMIGFSRFGQIASQILLTEGADVTIIDHSVHRVRSVEAFGFRIYYGDGRRKDVLEAAGIRQARIVAICTHGRETTDRIVDLILSDYPHVRLFVRAYDRAHAISLRARGAEFEIRETFESALAFGRTALVALGAEAEHAAAVSDEVRRRDEERLAMQVIGAGDPAAISPEPLFRPSRRRGKSAIEPQQG